jgi:hypothetical protein
MTAGLLILFLGPLLLGVLPAETYWSEADQAEYEKASTAAHAAAFGGDHDHTKPHSHEAPTDAEGQAKRDATQAEFEVHNARLKAAQSSRQWLGIGCRVLGIVVAAGGVLLYVRAKSADK